MIWHEERDLGEVDAVVVPGGFSYGDYLRAGALARFSPAMEAVAALRRRGRTRARDLQRLPGAMRGGLLPGALLTNDGIRFVCRQVELIAAQTASPFTAGIEPGERLSIPVKHESGRYFAPSRDPRSDRGIGPGRLPLRARAEPERLEQRHSRGDQRGGQRPRPDAPPGACRGPADRLRRRAAPVRERRRSACVSAVAEREQRPSAAPRARPHRLPSTSASASCSEREPNGVELAMFSLLWSEHCAYKHSRKLLRRLPTEGPRVVMGPGENAGAVDVGDGLGGRLQGRVPQPPERGRAVPGGGHRRRRHPARRLRARRAADRDARLAALRRARLGALPLPVRRRSRAGSATTATRSACRPSAARSTSRRPTSRTAWSTRCASGSPARRRWSAPRPPGSGNADRADRRLDRPRRDRRRLRACLGRARRRRRLEAPHASRSATPSRSRSCSSAASSCSARTCWSPSRTSAPPA